MPPLRSSKKKQAAPSAKAAPSRVTSRTVAADAGVSVFTVSQVMAGRAGVAPATRARVLAAAARLGYRPDPAAARLVALRHRRAKDSSRLVVTMLARDNQPSLEYLKPRLDGYAGQLGLELRFHAISASTSPASALRVLWQQGTQGLILQPCLELATPAWRHADWSRFSVFKSTRGLPELPFHLVRHGAWDYMHTTLSAVIARGYRRIAVLLHNSINPSDNLARLGAVLVSQERLFPAGTVCEWREHPPQFDEPRTVASIVGWLRSYRPDVLVAPYGSVVDRLIAEGFRVPGDFAVACVLCGPRPAQGIFFSGCDNREPELYEVCLHQLREMILKGERGVPALPFEHVIPPLWLEGDTLPFRT